MGRHPTSHPTATVNHQSSEVLQRKRCCLTTSPLPFLLHWHERHGPGVRGWHAGTGNARMIPTAAILTSMRPPGEAESGHSRLVSATAHSEPVEPVHAILAESHCENIIAILHVSYNDTRTHIKHRSHFGSRYHIRLMRLASLFRLASDPVATSARLSLRSAGYQWEAAAPIWPPICWLPVGG